MSSMGLVATVGLAVLVLVVGAILGAMGLINEERRPHSGNCTAWDRDPRICWWDRQKRGEYAKGCEHHKQQPEKETEDGQD